MVMDLGLATVLMPSCSSMRTHLLYYSYISSDICKSLEYMSYLCKSFKYMIHIWFDCIQYGISQQHNSYKQCKHCIYLDFLTWNVNSSFNWKETPKLCLQLIDSSITREDTSFILKKAVVLAYKPNCHLVLVMSNKMRKAHVYQKVKLHILEKGNNQRVLVEPKIRTKHPRGRCTNDFRHFVVWLIAAFQVFAS